MAKGESLIASLDIHPQVPVSPLRSRGKTRIRSGKVYANVKVRHLQRNSWLRPRARRLEVTRMFRYVREPTDMNLKGRSVKASILLEPRLLINDERLLFIGCRNPQKLIVMNFTFSTILYHPLRFAIHSVLFVLDTNLIRTETESNRPSSVNY